LEAKFIENTVSIHGIDKIASQMGS